MRDIGKNIRDARVKGGITQDQLAERLDVSRQIRSLMYETGHTRPDIEILERDRPGAGRGHDYPPLRPAALGRTDSGKSGTCACASSSPCLLLAAYGASAGLIGGFLLFLRLLCHSALFHPVALRLSLLGVDGVPGLRFVSEYPSSGQPLPPLAAAGTVRPPAYLRGFDSSLLLVSAPLFLGAVAAAAIRRRLLFFCQTVSAAGVLSFLLRLVANHRELLPPCFSSSGPVFGSQGGDSERRPPPSAAPTTAGES